MDGHVENIMHPAAIRRVAVGILSLPLDQTARLHIYRVFRLLILAH